MELLVGQPIAAFLPKLLAALLACHLLGPQVQEQHQALDGQWVWFQQVLIDSEISLHKQMEKFNNSLMLAAEEFKKKVQATVKEFSSTGDSLTHTDRNV